MNNSNSRDVQDLIAEFVNSKNQLLHEEIISSIKRESFANQLEEESPQVDISAQENEVPAKKPAEDIEILKKKIEHLTERNLELQQELTINQMQESQTIASAKPIGADELRMEFLNFTSAHIQQFNTRIKKTEELIESQIQKNQGPSEKKTQRDYPVWLFWANTAALGLIAVYFIFQLFSGNDKQAISSGKEPDGKTVVTVSDAAADKSPAIATEEPGKLTESNPPKETAALPASESAATPFHNPAQPVITEKSLEDRNIPVSQTANVQKTATPAVNKVPVNTPARTTAINTAATQVKPVIKAPAKMPQQSQVSITTKSAAQQKTVATTATTKVQTEKKASDKEKVYFGED